MSISLTLLPKRHGYQKLSQNSDYHFKPVNISYHFIKKKTAINSTEIVENGLRQPEVFMCSSNSKSKLSICPQESIAKYIAK